MNEELQNIIKHKYLEEIDEELYQMETNRFSVTTPVADTILFELIAERFSISRTQLLTQCLDVVAKNLFLALEDKDKLEIGKQADELLVKYLKGIHEEFNSTGTLKWGTAAFCQTHDFKSDEVK